MASKLTDDKCLINNQYDLWQTGLLNNTEGKGATDTWYCTSLQVTHPRSAELRHTLSGDCHRMELSTPHETTQLDFFNTKGILQNKTQFNETNKR